jgi:hypothetical protein
MEVIKFRDLIRVTDLPRFVPGTDEPTMEVLGEDFSSIEKILINGERATDYIVVNKSTLWVVIPESARHDLRSIEVVSNDFTVTAAASKMTFELGDTPKKISGLLSLTQLYTKWLLQSPGSDIFNPSRGGGLQDLVGQLISLSKMDHILSSITRSVAHTTEQIRAAQLGVSGLTLDERLLDATLMDVDRSADKLEARARVQVIAMSGEEALSSITL